MSVLTCSFSRGAAPLLQMKLDLDPERPNERTILGHLQTGHSFEPDVANVLVRVLREGDVAVDVGANIGYLTTLAALLVGPTGRVVAFEPGPENLARLRANLALNDCTNVTVVEKAVTNQVGDVEFFINSDDSGGNALWDPAQYPGNVKCLATPIRLTVPGTTLDAELEQLRLKPKVIKIDTEGAEQKVLEGMRGLLASQEPRFIIAELHDFGLAKLGCSQQSLRGFIEGLGYSTFALTYGGALPRFIPPATCIECPYLFINLLFSKPECVGEYWPAVVIDPRDPR